MPNWLPSSLDLNNPIGEEQEEIARLNLDLNRLKLRIWNNPDRRARGISANRHTLYFTGTSPRPQRRWVTGASEARVPHSDIDYAVEHRNEHERAGLL